MEEWVFQGRIGSGILRSTAGRILGSPPESWKGGEQQGGDSTFPGVLPGDPPFPDCPLTCHRGLNPWTSPSILWPTRSSYFGTPPSWRLLRWGTPTCTSSSASSPCVILSCQRKRTKVSAELACTLAYRLGPSSVAAAPGLPGWDTGLRGWPLTPCVSSLPPRGVVLQSPVPGRGGPGHCSQELRFRVPLSHPQDHHCP